MAQGRLVDFFLLRFQWWTVEGNWVGEEVGKEDVGGRKDRCRDSRGVKGYWWDRGVQGISRLTRYLEEGEPPV